MRKNEVGILSGPFRCRVKVRLRGSVLFWLLSSHRSSALLFQQLTMEHSGRSRSSILQRPGSPRAAPPHMSKRVSVPSAQLRCANVPVYGPNTPCSRAADYHVLRSVARTYVSQGIAIWINRANAIRMIMKKLLAIRDQSCRCGMRVMEAFADGKQWAVDIVARWATTAAQIASAQSDY